MDNKEPQPIKKDTLDFIFEYTKNAPEIQLKDAEALDNKVIQILSISSVIIGLIAFAVSKGGLHTCALVSLSAALVAYIGLALSAFIHLKGAPYRRSLQADKLWEMFWEDDVSKIKHSLVKDISKSYAFNKGQIDKKRRTLLAAVICGTVEVIAVGIFLISTFLP